ncbi:uncharacterized protein ARB_05107 [Trichophyton benhamiae CBS 112371]|uniref:Uncharacterized protein n=1 Tax=Arthroderma benhamiae (strain ATCC MYA-4681 / CBS 112371) TaxID=663331 RepID=D4ALB0_ARTBC|nr:uncharacterized protein ARB_05107 [Trichophyton benhamiae CBS 112371]EFE36169.1 hypothetical protein ARB_05107 [Trichophyton benhamiae CBS 112371]
MGYRNGQFSAVDTSIWDHYAGRFPREWLHPDQRLQKSSSQETRKKKVAEGERKKEERKKKLMVKEIQIKRWECVVEGERGGQKREGKSSKRRSESSK